MILGADNQNKNLRIASNIKSNPTAKARTGNHYSAAITTSKTSGGSSSAGSQRTITHESKTNINNGRPDPIRGSMEGLDSGKSTHIQMSNRGYDSKSVQTARYSSKEKNVTQSSGASFLFTNKQKQGIMDNYSGLTSAGSSSDLMSKNLRINRMF
jgi:hypothetical protein